MVIKMMPIIEKIVKWLLFVVLCNSDCYYHYTGASCLGELLKVNNSLQKLYMRDNYIGDDGMSSIADGLQHNNTLTKLDVSWCKFSVKGSYSNCSVQDVAMNLHVVLIMYSYSVFYCSYTYSCKA